MNYLNELLRELTARLPELEWKISEIGSFIHSQNIPRGLFRSVSELTGASCIEEIKTDIYALSHQDNERSAYYLANRIKQKVNVLVALCQIESKKNHVEEKVYFGMKMLSTRQQWITTLEHDIKNLEKQQQAMLSSLEHMKSGSNTEAILSLQSELGKVEQRLTLARESLNQAVS